MGKKLKDFKLEHLIEIEDAQLKITKDINDALKAPVPQHCINARHMLNNEQVVYNVVMECVNKKRGGAFFIDGPRGTGKTFLYNALYAKVRLLGKIVLPTATSRIAASNIRFGRTIHSRFKISINVDTSMACNVPKQGSLTTLIRECSLFIWDEASMIRKENIEALDLLLRDLCDENIPFGGKVIVFGGDFRQVLPVVPQRSQHEVVNAILISSSFWNYFLKFTLHPNIRAKEDPEFSSFLLALGD